MICLTCGSKLDEDSKFCEVCGNPVQLTDNPEPEQETGPIETPDEVNGIPGKTLLSSPEKKSVSKGRCP